MFAARERIDEHGTVFEERHLDARISPDPLAARQVAALDPQARDKAWRHAQHDALAVAAREADTMPQPLPPGGTRGESPIRNSAPRLGRRRHKPPLTKNLRRPAVKPPQTQR